MKTLAQIRASLPIHIPLAPGIHKRKKGDEILYKGQYWVEITPSTVGEDYDGQWPQIAIRRPIPPEVLDHQAWEIATIGMDETAKIRTFGEEKYRELALSTSTYTSWLQRQIEAA